MLLQAIDEAEDEWSQHNAKKLIDTSEKGLRGSIPKNFPYFHVEFGLQRGFVHVIDDEKEFKSSFGLNVIRGILRLPAEDMHRRRKHESMETQKQAVASFAQDWEPFDWTKQLDQNLECCQLVFMVVETPRLGELKMKGISGMYQWKIWHADGVKIKTCEFRSCTCS